MTFRASKVKDSGELSYTFFFDDGDTTHTAIMNSVGADAVSHVITYPQADGTGNVTWTFDAYTKSATLTGIEEGSEVMAEVTAKVDMSEEWGCKPYVRKLSWGDLKRVQTLDIAEQVCVVLCDEDGTPIYSEEEAHLLEKFHTDDLKKVLDVATSFNSLDEQSELLDVLDEDELSEQLAFDQLEPMDNAYWRNGLLIEVLIRLLGSSKGSKLKPETWMRMSSVGSINIGMRVNTGGLSKGLGNARGQLQGFSGAVSSVGISISRANDGIITSFAKIGLAIQGVQSLARGIVSAVSGPLSLAASNEQTMVSFEVLTGSAEQATKTLGELRDFASSTPFQLPEISDSAKKLIAFGFSADEVTGELRKLGDISAGLNIPLSDLSDIYGKAR
ncbi:Phage tape measure protein, partial [Durusdinium trenchii]